MDAAVLHNPEMNWKVKTLLLMSLLFAGWNVRGDILATSCYGVVGIIPARVLDAVAEVAMSSYGGEVLTSELKANWCEPLRQKP